MYAMTYDRKAVYKNCVYGILDVKMSNGRGDFAPPPPPNIMYPSSNRNKIFPIS